MEKKGVMARSRYVTQDLPGTGGIIRAVPEDFLVEEIPLSEPKGEGDHLYLWVEKKDSEIGYAGMKDAKAVARQWISVQLPGRDKESALSRIELDLPRNVRILRLVRGRSKLRRGALRGNRFEIRLRNSGHNAVKQATAILEVLQARGFPNAFGQQRFGSLGHSAEIGFAMVLGDWGRSLDCLLGGGSRSGNSFLSDEEEAGWLREAKHRYLNGDFAGAFRCYPPGWEAERRVLSRLSSGSSPEKAVRAIPRREKMLFGSAFQAAIFNACLAKRIKCNNYDCLLPGDVAIRHESGKSWRIAEPKKDDGPWTRFEVSPAGPLLGERMLKARGEPSELEKEVFEELGITEEAAEKGLAKLGLRGGRRPYRMPIEDLDICGDSSDLLLRFVLPPGAYATEVLREVTKSNPPVGTTIRFGVPSKAVISLNRGSEEGEKEA
jgi:tRNA pseudouridine13 synthase